MLSLKYVLSFLPFWVEQPSNFGSGSIKKVRLRRNFLHLFFSRLILMIGATGVYFKIFECEKSLIIIINTGITLSRTWARSRKQTWWKKFPWLETGKSYTFGCGTPRCDLPRVGFEFRHPFNFLSNQIKVFGDSEARKRHPFRSPLIHKGCVVADDKWSSPCYVRTIM